VNAMHMAPPTACTEGPAAPLTKWRFDPSPCQFPPPIAPMLAPLRWQGLCWRQAPRTAATVPTQAFHQGRYALHHAYRLSGLGPGTVLLAPSYHCLTMLDGALRLKAEIQLYPLNPDLSPDLSALQALLDRLGPKVRAVLATHYFGFEQNFRALATVCEAHGAHLIEDCSHLALIGPSASGAGAYGDWATSSPYKFFPIPTGGLLWRPDGGELPLAPARAGRLEDAKATLRSLVSLCRRDTEQISVDSPTRVAPANAENARQWQEPLHLPSAHYRSADEGRTRQPWADIVIRHTDTKGMKAARRRNFEAWLQHSKLLHPFAQPLFSQLPEGCTPYAFPMLLTHAERRFSSMKHTAVPIWRWDELAVSGCAVATQYRLGLLHLPCHQGLSEAHIHTMAQRLQRALIAASSVPEVSPS